VSTREDTVRRAPTALTASVLILALAALAGAAGPDSHWAVPPEGACQPAGGLRGWPVGEDAPPIPFAPGDVIDFGAAEVLKSYLPAELWNQRDQFFFEGMRLEIGPCFRDYSPPAFFDEATRAFAGQARLDPEGGLEGYTAGLPFPPAAIDPADPAAGLAWAWNVEARYQAAGFSGRFRIMDMVGRAHRGEPFEGEIFKALLSFRADRPDEGYKSSQAQSYHWVAGGRFTMPFAAREFSWRQYRDVAHLTAPERTDDLHAYLPEWRRVRRLSAVAVEGLYLPGFSVGVVPATQIAVGGSGASAGGAYGGGGLQGGGGLGGAAGGAAVASSIKPKRNGFEGLEIRPLLYAYKVIGLQDVLAPINAAAPAYPENPDRDFGPWGLSFASDRWDLRRALVLEGTLEKLEGDAEASRILHYVDLQTLQPLYYVSWDKDGELIDVGMYVGRWSEDRQGYAPWPDDSGRAVRVIDPVGAAFANVRDDGGWRRENWDTVSTPPDDDELRRMLSVGQLTKRR